MYIYIFIHVFLSCIQQHPNSNDTPRCPDLKFLNTIFWLHLKEPDLLGGMAHSRTCVRKVLDELWTSCCARKEWYTQGKMDPCQEGTEASLIRLSIDKSRGLNIKIYDNHKLLTTPLIGNYESVLREINKLKVWWGMGYLPSPKVTSHKILTHYEGKRVLYGEVWQTLPWSSDQIHDRWWERSKLYAT